MTELSLQLVAYAGQNTYRDIAKGKKKEEIFGKQKELAPVKSTLHIASLHPTPSTGENVRDSDTIKSSLLGKASGLPDCLSSG